LELIEKMLGLHLIGIYHEGRRLVEIKLLVLMLQSIKFVRLIALSFLLCSFAFGAHILGVFIFIIQSISLYQRNGVISFDLTAISGLSLAILGGLATFLALREKTWLRICHIDQYMQHAMQVKESSSPAVLKDPQFEMLSSVVSSIVEQKLRERDELGRSRSATH